MITSTPTKNSGFITGIYGENNTYKAIAGADLFKMVFMHKLEVNA
jgi:vitamin B12 transporter